MMFHRHISIPMLLACTLFPIKITRGFLNEAPCCILPFKRDLLSLSVSQKQGVHVTPTHGRNRMNQSQNQDLLNQHEFPFNSATFDEVMKELNILKGFKDHIEVGLDDNEVKERLDMYGMNYIPPKPRKSLLALFAEQFDDRLVQILLIVAFFSTISSVNEIMSLVSSTKSPTIAIGQTEILQSFIEPGIIVFILMINAAIGVWQQSSALDSMDSLKKLQSQVATVLRSNDSNIGKWFDRFDASLLVPGDIVILKQGDMIPADIKLIHLDSSTFSVNESSLTGESISVIKYPIQVECIKSTIEERSKDITISGQHGMAFSGTMVTKGFAKGIVVRTGSNTELGKIQHGVMLLNEMKTPLEQKLDKFADDLAHIIAYLCLAVWVMSIPRFNDPDFESFKDGALYYGKVCVALGVAAIPEGKNDFPSLYALKNQLMSHLLRTGTLGLPAVITLVLSLGTKRLAERNVIVRKLPCIETLGCVTVICTDKTGTLTTNQMSVVSLLTFENQTRNNPEIVESVITGSSFKPLGEIYDLKDSPDQTNHPKDFELYSDIISVCFGCNNAKLVKDDNDMYSVIGEPTEGALLCLAEKLGQIDYDDTLPCDVDANRRVWDQSTKRSATLDFSNERKSMSVIYEFQNGESKTEGKYMLLGKGAPNILLERSSKIKLRDGTLTSITPEFRERIKKQISLLSERPLRCLLLVERHIDSIQWLHDESFKDFIGNPDNYSDVESNLTILGIVGMKDPVRLDSAISIERCTQAGVRVIVISGDSRETTAAIAKELDVLRDHEDNDRIFTGTEFFAKPKSEQFSLLSRGNIVFCRTEPIHKQLIVKRLQSINEIVAMSGDGVNDSPALRQASIGVAMGSGSEIAKEASDMVLADDSFATIVNGIEEGRFIFNNIEAFINFLISCNVGEVLAVFFSTIMGLPPMLSALQLLWINLATDGPAAVALGFNPTTDDVMKTKPRNVNQEIITPWQLVRYFVVGFYIAFATVSVFTHQLLLQGISCDYVSHWASCATATDLDKCKAVLDHETITLAQTAAITTIITTELLKALSTVSVKQSVLKVSPFLNPFLVVGVLVPFILHLVIMYNPVLSSSFGLMPLSFKQWSEVFFWSIPIVAVDEMLKFIERKNLE